MASHHVLAVAGPLVKDEGRPVPSIPGSAEEHHLNLASHYVLAVAGPLAKDEG